MDNDDFSMSPYIAAVLRRWYVIMAAMLLLGIFAGVLSLILPRSYQATASVLILIQQTGSQFGTNQSILSIETIDTAARRQGLIALAEDNAIETKLPADVVQQVAPKDYRMGQLVDVIEVSVYGDLLRISAKASTPEGAQALANAWTATYVDYVQTLYTDPHSQIRLAGSAVLPYEPSEPKILRNIVLGLIAGVILGVASALLFELFGQNWRILRRAGSSSTRTSATPSPTH
jgi:capsular polysaccharide biosynthesis protein